MYLIMTLVGIGQPVAGQQYDRHWIGRVSIENGSAYAHAFMQFGTDSIRYIETDKSTMRIGAGTFAISNAAGELQFYTNGNVIASWDNTIMEGGKGFNEGSIYSDFKSNVHPDFPDTTWNTAYFEFSYFVIPDEDDDQVYYMIHGLIKSPADYSKKMQISKIDMSANNGKGKVVYKNRYFDEDDTLPSFRLIRHGNGRDWWVVMRKPEGLSYRSVLLRKDSVVQVVVSSIPQLDSDYDEYDYMCMKYNFIDEAPDGSTLVDNNGYAKLKIIYFDRCSGEVSLIDTLSLGTHYNYHPYNWGTYYGFQISPSGRYLYGAGYTAYYAQWDLEAPDIGASRVQLGGKPLVFQDNYLNLKNPIQEGAPATIFSLGPDGKVYALTNKYHNVIEHPDEPGEACGFCLASDFAPESCLGLSKPVYDLFTPKYPNYRLGPLEGSGCDTLLSEVVAPLRPGRGYSIEVSPNPALSQAHVAITLPRFSSSGGAGLQVADMLGRIIYTHQFPPYAYIHSIDVQSWPPGAYTIILTEQGLPRATARLMVGGR